MGCAGSIGVEGAQEHRGEEHAQNDTESQACCAEPEVVEGLALKLCLVFAVVAGEVRRELGGCRNFA